MDMRNGGSRFSASLQSLESRRLESVELAVSRQCVRVKLLDTNNGQSNYYNKVNMSCLQFSPGLIN